MRNIVVVTPWPLQHSGIADYAFNLVQGLIGRIPHIEVYTNCKKPVALPEVSFTYCDNGMVPDLNEHDVIVYQMGNNSAFHLHMIEILKRHGGIVHLHDMVLHNMVEFATRRSIDADSYLKLIARWYGEKVRDLVTLLLSKNVMPWNSDIVTALPLFEEVLQYANSCIVHSDYARRRIIQSLPHLKVYKIDQLYNGLSVVEEKNDPNNLDIGVFGVIAPQKRVDVILKIFSRIIKINKNCKLHIVGEIDDGYRYITNIPIEYGIKKHVRFYGRVRDAQFHNLLSRMDICLSLRFPTMGETSAVVMKMLQMGIPVIVNNEGWYSELPDFIDKVPVQECEDHLYDTLLRYVEDFNYLSEKRKKFVSYAKESFNFEDYITCYRNTLLQEYENSLNAPLYKSLGRELDRLDLISDDNTVLRKGIVGKLYNVFK
ncbi:MAG: glycosyltransferase family 4 protein [Spirochaetota bacterium]|nr:MAG: glycosyltransferase family 4 protein [Spirochaetota bacterium]